MRRRLFPVAVFATALLFIAAMPAAAVGPFGPSQLLLGAPADATCVSTPGGDAAIATDGTTRGFAAVCDTSQIWFFSAKPGSAPVREPSPYVGTVLSVAWDGVDAAYVLFVHDNGLSIGKRIASSGVYAPATTLSTRPLAFSGDVVASGGKWWAVWGEHTGPTTSFLARTEIYQRHTLLGVQGRTRITNTGPTVTNDRPTLAYASSQVTMVWSRQTDQRPDLDNIDLRIATNTGSGWSSRPFASLGLHNQEPDVTIYGGVTWVGWARDEHAVVANNAGGTFHSRTFATVGGAPTVAVSGSHAFVAWAAFDIDGYRAFLAELSGGVWTGSQVSLPHSIPRRVLAQGTKARVVYEAAGGLHLRTQT